MLGPKECYVQENLSPKKFWVQKNLSAKKCWPKNFLVNENLHLKENGSNIVQKKN